MKFLTIAATLLAAASAAVLPETRTYKKCLSLHKAEEIVADFITILEHYDIPAANATAQRLLSEEFQEVSDSILSLQGLPLGDNGDGGKYGYIAGVLAAPPVAGINTLQLYVAGCTRIIWYWRFDGIGTAEYPIQGFNLFAISDEYQIDRVNLEFNSIAWGLNTGYEIIYPPGFPLTPERV